MNFRVQSRLPCLPAGRDSPSDQLGGAQSDCFFDSLSDQPGGAQPDWEPKIYFNINYISPLFHHFYLIPSRLPCMPAGRDSLSDLLGGAQSDCLLENWGPT